MRVQRAGHIFAFLVISWSDYKKHGHFVNILWDTFMICVLVCVFFIVIKKNLKPELFFSFVTSFLLRGLLWLSCLWTRAPAGASCDKRESNALDSSVVSFLPNALGILRDSTVKSDLTLLCDKLFPEWGGDSGPAPQVRCPPSPSELLVD